MLNSFKSPQRIALIGGTSEIGNAIIEFLPKGAITEVIRIDRKNSDFDATDEVARRKIVDSLFVQDVDIVIIAIGALGNDTSISKESNLLNMIQVNYVATTHLLYLIASKMKVQCHGEILIISSFAQERPRKDNFAYGSTKAGIDFYARGLAQELRSSGVSLKILRPGFVTTRMTAGMKPAPFTISPKQAGLVGAKLIQGRSRIGYAPSILKLVAIVFRKLPEKIFIRLT